MHSFAMNIYPGDVVSKNVLKFFRNLLQSGDGTSAKKLDEDLDTLWASKGGNVDLSKWSKDDFSTGLIPDDIHCKYFAGKNEMDRREGKNPIKKPSAKRKFLPPMERQIFMGGLNRTRKERSF